MKGKGGNGSSEMRVGKERQSEREDRSQRRERWVGAGCDRRIEEQGRVSEGLKSEVRDGEGGETR